MTERWRLFVAVPIDDGLRAQLADCARHWARHSDLAGLRWTDPDAWHITLAFLGSVDTASVDGVARKVADAARSYSVFSVRTSGVVGGFPSRVRARVAWYGIDDGGGSLREVATDLRVTLGVGASSPFRAHVTLARAKRDPVDLRTWVVEASAPSGEVVVDRLDLMRSHLGRGPARYELIASEAMREAARA